MLEMIGSKERCRTKIIDLVRWGRYSLIFYKTGGDTDVKKELMVFVRETQEEAELRTSDKPADVRNASELDVFGGLAEHVGGAIALSNGHISQNTRRSFNFNHIDIKRYLRIREPKITLAARCVVLDVETHSRYDKGTGDCWVQPA